MTTYEMRDAVMARLPEILAAIPGLGTTLARGTVGDMVLVEREMAARPEITVEEMIAAFVADRRAVAATDAARVRRTDISPRKRAAAQRAREAAARDEAARALSLDAELAR